MTHLHIKVENLKNPKPSSSPMAAPNGSHSNWADQAPIAVAPLNCVRYTGPPLDDCDSEQNKLSPRMVYLPQQPSAKEMDDIMSATKHGVLVSGSAASGIIGLLMGSYNLSESDDSLLFRFALPGVTKDEKFKSEIQPDGTIKIQGVTHNLSPPGDFAVRFHLPANVDPSAMKIEVDKGVLEGVVKMKPVQG